MKTATKWAVFSEEVVIQRADGTTSLITAVSAHNTKEEAEAERARLAKEGKLSDKKVPISYQVAEVTIVTL